MLLGHALVPESAVDVPDRRGYRTAGAAERS
jgi:hypothetical protein